MKNNSLFSWLKQIMYLTLPHKVLFNSLYMVQEEDHLKTLNEIRDLMEQSSRFLSLSGLSGIFAGIFALLGALVAYFYMDIGFLNDKYYELAFIDTRLNANFLVFFFADAMIVLGLALSVGLYFTYRNAKKKNNAVWTPATKRLTINLMIPLVAGGLFCLLLVHNHVIYLVAPSTLIFYGIALINGSKYTLTDVRYLGISEIVLGLIGCIWVGYGLIIWAIGFGVLHIIYGTVMYFRYEK
jgi:hypothetical protein